MFRKRLFSACLLVAGGSFVGPMLVGQPVAAGEEAVLDELYGRGVHQFFALDYTGAMQQLTLAIENGSKDPRAYYFRGLAAAALGQFPQTDSDFRSGAMIEARGAFNGLVGSSLVRVQGPVRLHLEKLRQLARLDLLAERRMRDDIRFNQGVQPGSAFGPGQVTPPSTRPGVPPTGDGSNAPSFDDPMTGDGEPQVDSGNSLDGAMRAAQPTPVAPAAGDATPAPAPGVQDTPQGDSPFPFGNEGGTDDPFPGF